MIVKRKLRRNNQLKLNTEEETPMIRHLMSKLVRKEKLEGKDHLVCPTVLICEGVHNGVLYTAEDISKYPESWNGRPVVVWHPENNGKPVSAASPTVLKQSTVGVLYNTKYKTNLQGGAGLVSEVWLDVAKCEKVAPKILTMLENSEGIEVSTGLFTDDEEPKLNEATEWKGETFSCIARNYRPDHLALLPGGKGACSWDDGAGMPRLNAQEDTETNECRFHINDKSLFQQADEVRSAVQAQVFPRPAGGGSVPMEMDGYISDIYDDYAIFRKGQKMFRVDYSMEDGEITVDMESMVEVRQETTYMPIKANTSVEIPDGMTLGQLRTEISDALKKKLEIGPNPHYLYVEDVMGEEVIYTQQGKAWSVGWSVDDEGNIQIGANPVMVEKVITWEPKVNAGEGNPYRDENGRYTSGGSGGGAGAKKAGGTSGGRMPDSERYPVGFSSRKEYEASSDFAKREKAGEVTRTYPLSKESGAAKPMSKEEMIFQHAGHMREAQKLISQARKMKYDDPKAEALLAKADAAMNKAEELKKAIETPKSTLPKSEAELSSAVERVAAKLGYDTKELNRKYSTDGGQRLTPKDEILGNIKESLDTPTSFSQADDELIQTHLEGHFGDPPNKTGREKRIDQQVAAVGARLQRQREILAQTWKTPGSRAKINSVLPSLQEVKKLLPSGAKLIRFGTTSVVYLASDGIKQSFHVGRDEDGKLIKVNGGRGSGNFGHSGREGMVGGSGEGDAGGSKVAPTELKKGDKVLVDGKTKTVKSTSYDQENDMHEVRFTDGSYQGYENTTDAVTLVNKTPTSEKTSSVDGPIDEQNPWGSLGEKFSKAMPDWATSHTPDRMTEDGPLGEELSLDKTEANGVSHSVTINPVYGPSRGLGDGRTERSFDTKKVQVDLYHYTPQNKHIRGVAGMDRKVFPSVSAAKVAIEAASAKATAFYDKHGQAGVDKADRKFFKGV